MFEKYMKDLEIRLLKGVNKGLDILDQSIEDKSPVDTGEYIAGNKRNNAKRELNKIVGKVYNDSDNGYEVEYGFRSDPVNRHKNRRSGGPVIYRGVGARVYSRSIDENDQKIKDILKDSII